MTSRCKSFAVEPLFVPFTGAFSTSRTTARGALVWPSRGHARLVFMPPSLKTDDGCYWDEFADRLACARGILRDENPLFDRTVRRVLDKTLAELKLPWLGAAVFHTPSEYTAMRRLHAFGAARLVGVDPGVGNVAMATLQGVSAIVPTNVAPFIKTAAAANKSPAAKQVHAVYRQRKQTGAVQRAVAALGVAPRGAAMAIGSAFENRSTRNNRAVGGYASPKTVAAAAARLVSFFGHLSAFFTCFPQGMQVAYVDESYSTAIGVLSGAGALLVFLATYWPQDRASKLAGVVVARRLVVHPTSLLQFRASLVNSLRLAVAPNGAFSVSRVEPAAGAEVAALAATRGDVVEHFALAHLPGVVAGDFAAHDDTVTCGTPDGVLTVDGARVVVEVKSTMRKIDFPLLCSWFSQVSVFVCKNEEEKCTLVFGAKFKRIILIFTLCKLQIYMYHQSALSGRLVVKQFSPISPYSKSAWRVWRVGVSEQCVASLVSSAGEAPIVRAEQLLLAAAAALAEHGATLLDELELCADSDDPVTAALAAPQANNWAQLRANIAATLHARHKSPFDFHSLPPLMRSFVYKRRSVLYDPQLRRFVHRDASAASSIVWSTASMAATDRVVRVDIVVGDVLRTLGYFVFAPLVEAAERHGADLQAYASWQAAEAKRKMLYAMLALCDGDERALERIAKLDGNGFEIRATLPTAATGEASRVAVSTAAMHAAAKAEVFAEDKAAKAAKAASGRASAAARRDRAAEQRLLKMVTKEKEAKENAKVVKRVTRSATRRDKRRKTE